MTKLGRGLDALINSGPEKVDDTTGITTVDVSFIKPNRYQPRRFFDPLKLQELSNSLKENGIIQPIIVTKKASSEYELIAGERRLEAAKLANLKEVPVIIRSISPREQLQYAIIENIQRENLNPIEEAQAYLQLHEEFHLTHQQISDVVGKERTTVSNFIRLVKLSPTIQHYILTEKLTSGHARAILQIPEKWQEKFAAYIIENQLSVRKTEAEAKRIKQEGWEQKKHTSGKLDQVFHEQEKMLKQRYHVKVRIASKNNKGKISFYFSSDEEKERLLNLLQNAHE